MARAVGIDLGTTNSVIAVVEGGQPTVIPNAEGARTTPSVVAFTDRASDWSASWRGGRRFSTPRATIYSAKRFIGRRYDEVSSELTAVTYDVVAGPDGAVRFKIRDKLYAPEEISALVLRKLAEDAAKFLGEKVTEAVITVPAYFNDAQRQATKDAGRIAGLEVLRIINEPTAAALAYGLDKKGHETVLVFDLGGGTFDVSLLDVGDGVVEVRSTAGDTHLGGDDFDRRIVDHLAEDVPAGQRHRSAQGSRRPCNDCSRPPRRPRWSCPSVTQTTINLPFVTADANGPKHLNTTLMRSTFEQLTADLVERCTEPVQQAMADAKVTANDIDEVILVGGSTRIPAVQNLVRRMTGGKDPNMTVNPDEVVALGAAIQAAVIKGEVKDVLLLDVTPLSLGVETHGRADDQDHRAQHHHPGAAQRGLQHRRGQPARRRHRGPAGRARAGRRQPGPRPVPAGEHPPRAARRAADRGDLRHRRQRDPQRLGARPRHRRRAAHHDQRELEPRRGRGRPDGRRRTDPPRRGRPIARDGRCP